MGETGYALGGGCEQEGFVGQELGVARERVGLEGGEGQAVAGG